MVTPESACSYSSADVGSRYVARTLSEAESDAFEEHYFECESCWAEVRRGTEVKAALRLEAPAAIASRRLTRTHWIGIAAAAVFVAAVVLVPMRESSKPDVMRGTESAIAVTARWTSGGVHVAWNRVAAAARYRVIVSAGDGTRLSERETTATSIAIPIDTRRQRSLLATVVALSKDGEEIARSKPRRVASK